MYSLKLGDLLISNNKNHAKLYTASGNIFNGRLYLKFHEDNDNGSNICASLIANFVEENSKVFISGKINSDSDGSIAFFRGSILILIPVVMVFEILDNEKQTLLEVLGALLFGTIFLVCYRFYEKVSFKENAQNTMQYFNSFFYKIASPLDEQGENK